MEVGGFGVAKVFAESKLSGLEQSTRFAEVVDVVVKDEPAVTFRTERIRQRPLAYGWSRSTTHESLPPANVSGIGLIRVGAGCGR